ncbi:MAG: alpha/beta fold hydrolase [Nocardiaceae bacterium]|nr:alpha/beta fold hydrolase [Nocardiaceae bacterium]
MSESVERPVTGANGIALRAREWGDRNNSTVLLVHGYPDNSDVWLPVVERLTPRFHVVTYDVRGTGGSQPGEEFGGYGLDLLVADLASVLDQVVPRGRKVHLVAHDWGSIQSWEAVLDPHIAEYISTYTYFGAPALDHAAHWLRGLVKPDAESLGSLAGQLAKSWYIMMFQLPLVAPFLWRNGLDKIFPAVVGKIEGLRPEDLPTPAELQKDGAYGVGMYRANFIPKLLKPGEGRTNLPVQVIETTKDPFVHAGLIEEAARRVPNLVHRKIDAGHWVQRSHPDEVAKLIIQFIDNPRG